MIERNWADWKDRIVDPGSNVELIVNKLEQEGFMSHADFTAWVRTTPYIPECFTETQIGVALTSEFMILENYGAIKLEEKGIRWVG